MVRAHEHLRLVTKDGSGLEIEGNRKVWATIDVCPHLLPTPHDHHGTASVLFVNDARTAIRDFGKPT
jgi:hypothetical protein